MIVGQAHATERGGREQDEISRGRVNRRKIGSLADREILGVESPRAQLRETIALEARVIALAGIDAFGAAAERRVQLRREQALVWRQPAVLARKREAVGLAKRRKAQDLDRDEQISDHLPHGHELLKVPFTENHRVGRHDVDQLEQQGEPRADVARPMRALEDRRQACDVDPGAKLGADGKDFLNRRREQDVRSDVLQQRAIGFMMGRHDVLQPILRVRSADSLQIAAAARSARVLGIGDETHDDAVGAILCLGDQPHVALVDRSRGRHECHPPPLRSPEPNAIANRCTAREHFHGASLLTWAGANCPRPD